MALMNSLENKKHISRFKLMIRLLRMVKNHKWLMLQAIFYGILNHLTNILLIVYGAWLITGFFLLPLHFPSIFELILLFILAIIKAVSAYMEQIKNHDVAFRLLKCLYGTN
jgi:ATP-binding cassette subfamily C protein